MDGSCAALRLGVKAGEESRFEECISYVSHLLALAACDDLLEGANASSALSLPVLGVRVEAL